MGGFSAFSILRPSKSREKKGCLRTIEGLKLKKCDGYLPRKELRMILRFRGWVTGRLQVPLAYIGNIGGSGEELMNLFWKGNI